MGWKPKLRRSKPGILAKGKLRELITGVPKITGDLVFKTPGVFSAELKGNMYSEYDLVIASEAIVHGEVEAKSCDISGVVEGGVKVKEDLAIRAGGQVKGQCQAESLAVSADAKIKAKLEIRSEKIKNNPVLDSVSKVGFAKQAV